MIVSDTRSKIGTVWKIFIEFLYPLWFEYWAGKTVCLKDKKRKKLTTWLPCVRFCDAVSFEKDCASTYWSPLFSASYTSSSLSGWGTFGGGDLPERVNILLPLEGVFLVLAGVRNTERLLKRTRTCSTLIRKHSHWFPALFFTFDVSLVIHSGFVPGSRRREEGTRKGFVTGKKTKWNWNRQQHKKTPYVVHERLHIVISDCL